MRVCLVVGCIAFCLVLPFGKALAQDKTDLAVSAYGAFSGSATDLAAEDIPADAAGGRVEVRHIWSPRVGFEGTYALNRANQVYEPAGFCSLCDYPPVPVSADAHQISGDWVFSSHTGKVTTFALIGVGVLLYQPLKSVVNNTPAPTTSFTTPLYEYGAGVDWGIWGRLGLRLQYRGNFHNAPDITLVYPYPTGSGAGTAFTHTVEPTAGVYYKF
ncbi:MAG: hypothetical protein HIU91_03575 [Acidobacteria bacterium]|nr:hypothetical protein [Acidobacteriota bacterium]